MEIKARVNIDLNQREDPQDQATTVQIVVQVTLQRGARHLEKNATIVIKKAIFAVLQV